VRGGGRLQLVQLPPVNGVRPAADVTMISVAPIWRERLLAVVLTGMGFDGRDGARAVRAHGGTVFAQDEATRLDPVPTVYETLASGSPLNMVAGIRNTKPIAELANDMPAAFAELAGICERLERHYREMQDVEFTIERGKLWMLQTRNGKRSASAAIKIAVDMVAEGMIEFRHSRMIANTMPSVRMAPKVGARVPEIIAGIFVMPPPVCRSTRDFAASLSSTSTRGLSSE
jgi:hypothetical protein